MTTTLPDIALRDADRYAAEQGRIAAHEEHLDCLVDGMMEDVDEVADTIHYADGVVLHQAIARLLHALGHARRAELPTDVVAAYKVTDDYLRVLMREEAECRLGEDLHV